MRSCASSWEASIFLVYASARRKFYTFCFFNFFIKTHYKLFTLETPHARLEKGGGTACFERPGVLRVVENDFPPSVFDTKFFLIFSDFSVFSRFLLIFLFIFVSYYLFV